MLDFPTSLNLALAFLCPVLSLLTTCSEDPITDFVIRLTVGSVSVLAEKIRSQVMSAPSKSFHFAEVLYSGYEFGFDLDLEF